MLRSLWTRLTHSQVPDQGPVGAFARTIQAVNSGRGLASVLDQEDALEILSRALDPEAPREDFRYPDFPALPEIDLEAFEIGLRLLGAVIREEGAEPEEDLTVDLLVGRVVPKPGPGRRPIVDETLDLPSHSGELCLARVEYHYEGDEAGHGLHFYLDGDGNWKVDLVRMLVRAGQFQKALSEVQTPGCANEAFEV